MSIEKADKINNDSSPNVIIFKAIDHAIWFGLILFVLDRINKETFFLFIFFVSVTSFVLARDFRKSLSIPIKEMRFSGDIDELTRKMIGALGLYVTSKIGNYYVYKTCNRILPNTQYLVRDYGTYCMMILPRGHAHNIVSALGLKSIKEQSVISNTSTV